MEWARRTAWRAALRARAQTLVDDIFRRCACQRQPARRRAALAETSPSPGSAFGPPGSARQSKSKQRQFVQEHMNGIYLGDSVNRSSDMQHCEPLSMVIERRHPHLSATEGMERRSMLRRSSATTSIATTATCPVRSGTVWCTRDVQGRRAVDRMGSVDVWAVWVWEHQIAVVERAERFGPQCRGVYEKFEKPKVANALPVLALGFGSVAPCVVTQRGPAHALPAAAHCRRGRSTHMPPPEAAGSLVRSSPHAPRAGCPVVPVGADPPCLGTVRSTTLVRRCCRAASRQSARPRARGPECVVANRQAAAGSTPAPGLSPGPERRSRSRAGSGSGSGVRLNFSRVSSTETSGASSSVVVPEP